MEKRKIGIDSSFLHILGMIFMLFDHLWATVVPGNDWMTNIGRLTYPVFAFLAVEGYFHTSNLKKYILRMLIFAVVSEIPFNLMYGSSVFYPVHQNVLWTLLIGLILVHLNEMARGRGKWYITALTAIGTVVLGTVLGIVTFADYNTVGILTVLVFYFFRDRKWWCFIAQAVCLYYLNAEILKGLYFEVEILGRQFEVVRQSLAVFSLIPIWLYNGEKGIKSKWFKYFCYSFYPVHMLILWAIRSFISSL